MSYNSFAYLFLFLGAVWLLWAVLPRRMRPGVLLAASLFFYWATARRYIVYLLVLAAVAWVVGRQLGRLDALYAETGPDLPAPKRKALKKKVAVLRGSTLAAGTAVLLGALLWLKYLPFAAKSWAALSARISWIPTFTVPAYVQPLGISFFTLMGISYLVDVSHGTVPAAPRYWQVLSYLCFWPHVVEGPFDRAGALLPALTQPGAPSYDGFRFGIQRIVWGMFKKVVIADRANMYVKAVFDDWTQYSGAAVVVGTLLYTLQLYAEFSGCMDIVLGSAELFNIPLAENFRQPFFSRSIGEFWRRWHITLGAWLREYVFQPLVVSKPLMRFGKFCRTRFGAEAGRRWPVWLSLGVTWALIGLWHGAGWIYLVYGLYYFGLQFLGEACEPALVRLLPALPRWRQTRAWRLFQMLRTFVLVNFGMLLFRANGVRAALDMLRSLPVRYQGSLLIKLDARDMAVLVVGAVLLLAVDLLHERGHHLRRELAARPLPLRWAVYIGGVLAVMIFGAYGDNYDPAAFIYAQF